MGLKFVANLLPLERSQSSTLRSYSPIQLISSLFSSNSPFILSLKRRKNAKSISLGPLHQAKCAKFAPESDMFCLVRNDKDVEFIDLKSFKVESKSSNSTTGKSVSDSADSKHVNTANGTLEHDNSPVNGTSSSKSNKPKYLKFTQSCVSTKPENKLLGFFWVSPTMIVLVSKNAIEIFSFYPASLVNVPQTSSSGRSFSRESSSQSGSPSTSAFMASTASSGSTPPPLTKIKEIQISINWWTYSAPIRVLLISTEVPGTKLQPYHFASTMTGTEIIVLSKFKVDVKDPNTRLSKNDIYIRQIYGSVFVLYMNATNNEIVFYQLSNADISKILTITNLPKGTNKISFVDNCVLVHNTQLGITYIYDIRYRYKDIPFIDSPVIPPVSIARPMSVGYTSNNLYTCLEVGHTAYSDYQILSVASAAQQMANSSLRSNSSSSNLPSAFPSSNSSSLNRSGSKDIPNNDPESHPFTSSAPQIAGDNSQIPKSNPIPISSPSPSSNTESVGISISSSVDLTGGSLISPVSSPPSKLLQPSLSGTDLNAVEQSNSGNATDWSQSFSYNAVQFLIPEFAVNRKNGQIYRLMLNYDAIAKAFSDPLRLIQFLMRREFSRNSIFRVLKNLIQSRCDVRLLTDIFCKLNQSLQTHLTEKKLMRQAILERSGTSSPSPVTSTSGASKVAAPKQQPNDKTQTVTAGSKDSKTGDSPSNSKPSSPSQKPTIVPGDASWTKKRADEYFSVFKKQQSSKSLNANEKSTSSSNDPSRSPESTPSPNELHSEFGSPSSSLAVLPTMEELESSGMDQHVRTLKGLAVISQQDMYTQVFLPCEEAQLGWNVLVAVLIAYINSLTQFPQIQIDTYIYELIIDLLVRNKRFYQLHQLLQYRIIADSLHVACQLVYLESMYPPALQLALDMFRRLKEHAHTLEVLLTKGMLLPAVRFLASKSGPLSPAEVQRLVPRFLHEARNSEDPNMFYVVYNFFLQRKEITPACEEYTQYFNKEFPNLPAQKSSDLST